MRRLAAPNRDYEQIVREILADTRENVAVTIGPAFAVSTPEAPSAAPRATLVSQPARSGSRGRLPSRLVVDSTDEGRGARSRAAARSLHSPISRVPVTWFGRRRQRRSPVSAS